MIFSITKHNYTQLHHDENEDLESLDNPSLERIVLPQPPSSSIASTSSSCSALHLKVITQKQKQPRLDETFTRQKSFYGKSISFSFILQGEAIVIKLSI